jgi:16S rRNA (cytidine1402-2'-O)-methyltransferase
VASGRLVLVATPIGNLGDLSPRAQEELAAAEAWLVEDTRVSGKLRSAVGSGAPMRVLNDHTPPHRLQTYVEELAAGARWALVSDAGSPVVSDPGAEIVDACHKAGVEVDAVPGPSAAVHALGLSGFYGQRFAFLGFLPRRRGQASAVLAPFRESTLTLVAFEAAPRLAATLETMHGALGSRRFAICRELTKRHQQVWRGRLGCPPTEAEVPRKGETTVVVEGLRNPDADELV